MSKWTRFEARFPQLVIRYRWPIIVVSIVLIALAAAGTRHLGFSNSYRTFFEPTNPNRMALDLVENTYTKDDGLLLVVAPKNGEVFSPETLAIIAELTEQSWQVPHSNRVDSVTNFQHSVALDDDLFVGDLVPGSACIGRAGFSTHKGHRARRARSGEQPCIYGRSCECHQRQSSSTGDR